MEKLNLFQKINHVQKNVKSVFKDSKVSITQNSSYMAVSHDSVTALLHDPLANAGIVAFPTMDSAEVESFEVVKEYNGKETRSTNYRVKVWASVTFYDADAPTNFLQTKCFSYAIDTGDKATGKAYSMAIKYCYLKTFMLESCDEEESREYERSYPQNSPDKQDYQQPKTSTNQPSLSSIPASDAQKGALKKMGIEFNANITKSEASRLIENYNKGR